MYIRVGDWFGECLVNSLTADPTYVYLYLSATNSAVAAAKLNRDAVVGWETLLPKAVAEDYLDLFKGI